MPFPINEQHPSKNFRSRIRSVILHYTERGFAESLHLLTQGEVSSHYLINENTVYRLVDESLCAFHAGESYWQGRSHINDTSIGIEIVHQGFQENENGVQWLPYSEQQIAMVIALVKDIVIRYQIHPTCVIGHSDIAPHRKVDPGPLFPWKKLAEQGIGAWHDEAAITKQLKNFSDNEPDIFRLQAHLKRYGYLIQQTGIIDEQTQIVLRAFQMHFRPTNHSGVPDAETCAILTDLVKRYF